MWVYFDGSLCYNFFHVTCVKNVLVTFHSQVENILHAQWVYFECELGLI